MGKLFEDPWYLSPAWQMVMVKTVLKRGCMAASVLVIGCDRSHHVNAKRGKILAVKFEGHHRNAISVAEVTWNINDFVPKKVTSNVDRFYMASFNLVTQSFCTEKYT